MISTHEDTDAILAGEKPGGHDGPEAPNFNVIQADIDAGRYLTTGIDALTDPLAAVPRDKAWTLQKAARETLPLPLPFLPEFMMIEEPLQPYQQKIVKGLLGLPPERKKILFTKSDYLYRLLEGPSRFQETLDRAIQSLTPIQDSFQVIAFIGTSGALLAPLLALHFKKQLLLVRKPGVSTHSGYRTEGVEEACDYLFVDDMVTSGDTVRLVIELIDRDVPGCKLRGVYQYNGDILTTKPGAYVARNVSIAD